MGEFLLYMIISFICLILYLSISLGKDEKKGKKNQEVTKGLWEFDSDTGILTINKKHPNFAEMFEYREYESTQLRYMKEEYIFTAASSGNVTVGGVDKIGGYKEEKIKTDRYILYFVYDGYLRSRVNKIVLSKSLLDSAEQSASIKNYIVSNYIEITKDKIEPDPWVLSKASPTVRSILEEQAIIDTLPTKEKCKQIINWLSTQISSVDSTNTLTNIQYNGFTSVPEKNIPAHKVMCKNAEPNDFFDEIMARNPKLKIVQLAKYDCDPEKIYKACKNFPHKIIDIDFREVTFGFVCKNCKTCYVAEWYLPVIKYTPENDHRHPNNNRHIPNYINSQEIKEYIQAEETWQSFLTDLDDNMSIVLKNINEVLNLIQCPKCSHSQSFNKKNSFVMLYTDTKWLNRYDKYFKPFFEINAEIFDMGKYIDNYDIVIEDIFKKKI